MVVGAGLGSGRDGLFATEAVVPGSAVVPAPTGVRLEEAAAMGVAVLTAWNVVSLAGIGPEDRVLVLGAAGGVGSTIVSLAHALGATVWGQCGSADKRTAVLDQGADEVVVASAHDLADAARDLSPTAVTDPLGGLYTGAAFPSSPQMAVWLSSGPARGVRRRCSCSLSTEAVSASWDTAEVGFPI